MGDLVVDLGGLARLASALDRIGDRLESARSELSGVSDALGDEQVVDGLERFEERWRDGRQELRENAQTLSTMLQESVRTYTDVDADLAAGLRASVS